jgi:hypothetical protein
MKTSFHTIAEPMHLMMNRAPTLIAEYESFMAKHGVPYVPPVHKDETMMQRVGRSYAALHASDPHAYGRIMMEMRRGLVSVHEVQKDVNTIHSMRTQRRLERQVQEQEAA